MIVTIIIPVYNREFELRRAIASVLKQTVDDFEVLVVDDFSDLDIKSLLDTFSDKRIRYFRTGKKSNANVCRNIGLDNAKGEFVAMLDSDDEWDNDHLEKKINRIETLNADGLFSGFKLNDGINTRLRVIKPFYNNELMIDYILSGNTAATPTHFYYTKFAKEIRWDESLFRNQDYDFVVRFSEKYQFFSDDLYTCVVHWRKDEKRSEHIESQIRFIKKNQEKANRNLYLKFHGDIYSKICMRNDISQEVKKYLKDEVLNEIKNISFVDYLSFFANGKSRIRRLLCRINYIWLVIKSQ